MVPIEIKPRDFIGRAIFYNTLKKDIRNSIGRGAELPPSAFGAKPRRKISVDRLGLCSFERLTAIGDAVCYCQRKAGKLPDKSRFRGWLRLPVFALQEIGLQVLASKIDQPISNPYHADIIVPSVVFKSDNPRDREAIIRLQWKSFIANMCISLKLHVEWVDRCGHIPEDET